MAEQPFNPMLQGAAGPQRNDVSPDLQALLSLLAQAGAGPAADAMSRGNPNEELLRQLLFKLTGGFPGPRDERLALQGMRGREAGPGGLQPENLGESGALLSALLGGAQ